MILFVVRNLAPVVEKEVAQPKQPKNNTHSAEKKAAKMSGKGKDDE